MSTEDERQVQRYYEFMSSFNIGGVNTQALDSNELSPDFKRACHRQPPPQFTVELLPPTKQGSHHVFGLRIYPIERLGSSRSSRASSFATSEYDIWRTWEDWLWLQDVLEEDYNRLAREKRNRLLAGKGVKKKETNFYQQDASSWDSLPPGPDPNSVAQKFTHLVPLLAKKGTVFRPSQATIDRRFIEIKAFIEALFREDQPTLIQDLRLERRVTDFFGIWRRDSDIQRKALKTKRTSEASTVSSRSSISNSVFSMYFDNASAPSVDSQNKTHKFSFSSSTSNRDQTMSVTGSVVSLAASPSHKLDIPVIVTTQRHSERSRRGSVSSDSSSTSSSRSSTSSRLSLPSVADESPTPFGHNPHRADRSPSRLGVLPEDEEISLKGNNLSVPSDRRARAAIAAQRARRSAQLMGNPELINGLQSLDLEGGHRVNRDSWQSHMSGASAYADLGFSMPDGPARSSRMSVSSVATFMTDASVDAVLPRSTPRPRGEHSGVRRSNSVGDRFTRPLSDDGLDEYYFSEVAPARNSRPAAALGHYRPTSTMSLDTADFMISSQEDVYGGYETDDTLDVPMTARPARPLSPTASIVSSSASSSCFSSFSTATLASVSSIMSSPTFAGEDKKPISPTAPVTVKAVFDKTIVIFRATRDIPLFDARQRIKDKFAVQERLALTPSFTVALAMQESMKSRNSVISLASEGDLKIISTPEEWRWVMSYVDHSKITLRIFDD